MEGARYQQVTSVKETGVRTTIKWPYVNKIFYVQNCLWHTTFGPSIISSLTFAPMLALCRKIHPALMYYSRIFIFMIIVDVVMEALLVSNVVGLTTVFQVQTGIFGVAAFAFLGEFLVFLFVDIPIRLAWGISLVFKTTANIGLSNTFIEISKNERIDYVNTDLQNYALGASLERVQKVKIMLYTPIWESRYLYRNTVLQPLSILLFFGTMFFGTFIHYSIDSECNKQCGGNVLDCDVGINIPLFGKIVTSPVSQCTYTNNYDSLLDKCIQCNSYVSIIGIPLVNIGFSVAQMIAIVLAYVIIHALFHIVFRIVDIILCFIPSKIKSLCHNAMVKHAVRDIAQDKSSIQLDYDK
eukprot:c27341_g1_i1.p1 GENE.c27341_g1_i1~~c27341_g1_i1.p1  ORF type:complete len:354 (-),score=118.19 c27341_g1_i1:69-1130(-)